MFAKFFQYFRTIIAGMFVPMPVVHSITMCVNFKLFYRLTERAIRDACLRSQFNEYPRTQYVNQKHCKRNMFYPNRNIGLPKRIGIKNRVIKWIKCFYLHSES